jgi:hypothetical protein
MPESYPTAQPSRSLEESSTPSFAGGTSITSHSLTFSRKHLHGRFGSRFHDFIDEKQVCKQGAEMDGSVQIVNQLGTDGGLG